MSSPDPQSAASPHIASGRPETRPHWSFRPANREDIVDGVALLLYRDQEKTPYARVLVEGAPYAATGGWWVNVVVASGDGISGRRSLAAMGITPYLADNAWDASHYAVLETPPTY